MSEASRAAALQHAAAVHHGSGDPVATLETAEAFHAFIQGGEDAAPVKAAPAKAAAKAAPAKAAPAKAAPAKAAAEPDGDEVTKEQAGEAIQEMLNANLRPAAIALFAKYGAKSLSGVKPEDYAALKRDAEDAVMAA